MKYDGMCSIFGMVLNGIVKEKIADKNVRKDIKKCYKEIVLRAKDIGGSKNNLLSSYLLAAYFIAMNRVDKLTLEENIDIMEQGMRKSKIIKTFMGNSDGYFSEKKMAFRREWSTKTHERKFENNWVVDVVEKSDDFEFGLDYTECGVCKLCRDENCFEYAKYLCRLDYMLVEIMGLGLRRTMTLADGDDKCDFRFLKTGGKL